MNIIIYIIYITLQILNIIIYSNNIIKYLQEGHYHFLTFKHLAIHTLKEKWYFLISILFVFVIDMWIFQLIFITMYALYLLCHDDVELFKIKYTKRIIRLYIFLLITVISIFLLLVKYDISIYKSLLLIHYFLLPIILFVFTYLIPLENLICTCYHKKALKRVKKYKPFIIGITGSAGKTSIKNYLYELLKPQYPVIKTEESYNTINGISKTINKYLNSYCILILEMGASKKNDIKKITSYFEVDMAIISEILPQHLETFHSIDSIIKEKCAILNGRRKKTLFLNMDNEYIRDIVYEKYKDIHDVVSFSTVTKADIFAKVCELSFLSTHFLLTDTKKDITFDINTKVIGYHNVINIGLVYAVFSHLDFISCDNNYLKDLINNLENTKNRLTVKKIGNLTVISDCYNSNIKGFINALDLLSKTKKTKILITPGIVEAGKDAKRINSLVAKKITECLDEVYLIKNKMTNYYIEVFKESNFTNYYVKESFLDAYKILTTRDAFLLIENDLPDYYFL